MGRVFAISDLHGMYDIYEQVNKFIEPEDRVYFLGDAGDRGPEGWRTIKAIMSNPQWFYLKGNHEDMLVDAVNEYRESSHPDFYTHKLFNNGGKMTFEELIMEENLHFWLERLRLLPTCDSYVGAQGTIFLSHSGYVPKADFDFKTPVIQNKLIWDRNHIEENTFNNDSYDIVIHGHTPIHYIAEKYEPGAFWYCGNRKCCIDNATFHTGIACLLDLNTFDEHIFQSKIKI